MRCGVVLNFGHNDFATIDGARAWTIGWATRMLALKKYTETGQRDPFFAWRRTAPAASDGPCTRQVHNRILAA